MDSGKEHGLIRIHNGDDFCTGILTNERKPVEAAADSMP
jgi:hypothetical protein